jgi:hypothetical protein
MRVLKGILRESLVYYERLERDLVRRLDKLPQGSVKRRRIKGGVYYYLQQREGAKVVHRYLGRSEPSALIKTVQERRLLKQELAKARAALKLLPKRKLAP